MAFSGARCWIAGLGLALALAGGGGAAAATFSAFAEARLSLISVVGPIDSLVVERDGATSEVTTRGTSRRFADATASADVFDDLVLGASVGGGSSLYGGRSEAAALAEGALSLFNASEDMTLTLSFALDVALGAEAAADPLAPQFAGASALTLLQSVLFGVIADSFVEALSFGAGYPAPITDRILFEFALSPGEVDVLSLLALAEGEAVTPVPLPGGLGMLALGLGLLAVARRRAV